MSTGRLLKVPEVADLLRCNDDTVRRLASTGQLRGSKTFSQWRFEQEAVESFVKDHENTPDVTPVPTRRRRRRSA